MSSLWLVPLQGDPIGIEKSPVTVGRDASADVVLGHPSVSRKHAVLERDSDGWVVADQKSGNGTWVDGQRVIKAILREGQNLRFGAVAFTVSLRDPGPKRRSAARPPLPVPARGETVPVPPVPPAPAYPTPVPPPSSTMSVPEAAEIIGVPPGASADEVKKRYQRIYNDLQIRLTNAPTASLKRMYQKNLQNLKLAAETLAPGILGDRS